MFPMLTSFTEYILFVCMLWIRRNKIEEYMRCTKCKDDFCGKKDVQCIKENGVCTYCNDIEIVNTVYELFVGEA